MKWGAVAPPWAADHALDEDERLPVARRFGSSSGRRGRLMGLFTSQVSRSRFDKLTMSGIRSRPPFDRLRTRDCFLNRP